MKSVERTKKLGRNRPNPKTETLQNHTADATSTKVGTEKEIGIEGITQIETKMTTVIEIERVITGRRTEEEMIETCGITATPDIGAETGEKIDRETGKIKYITLRVADNLYYFSGDGVVRLTMPTQNGANKKLPNPRRTANKKRNRTSAFLESSPKKLTHTKVSSLSTANRRKPENPKGGGGCIHSRAKRPCRHFTYTEKALI